MTWAAPDGSYVVVEQSPAMSADEHDRLRPGMNHLALNAAGRAEVDAIVAEATKHGWTLMFADRHPYAGGPQHYAAFLHNDDGYELEIVAPTDYGETTDAWSDAWDWWCDMVTPGKVCRGAEVEGRCS